VRLSTSAIEYPVGLVVLRAGKGKRKEKKSLTAKRTLTTKPWRREEFAVPTKPHQAQPATDDGDTKSKQVKTTMRTMNSIQFPMSGRSTAVTKKVSEVETTAADSTQRPISVRLQKEQEEEPQTTSLAFVLLFN
jgi:hypothetical protein